jgi:hypothetical protein
MYADVQDTHAYACDTHTHTHTHIHTYIHTYIRTYVHTYVRTCIHTYMHRCMHACIKHTYMHTYAEARGQEQGAILVRASLFLSLSSMHTHRTPRGHSGKSTVWPLGAQADRATCVCLFATGLKIGESRGQTMAR